MATLHLMVGLPCSGKTTKAKKLEKKYNAILLSREIRQSELFGEEAESIMWDHASRVLRLGLDVILDFGFWFRAERESYCRRAGELGVDVKIHYMDVPLNTLYKRLAKRNEKAPAGTIKISKDDMDRYVSIFQPPGRDEPG